MTISVHQQMVFIHSLHPDCDIEKPYQLAIYRFVQFDLMHLNEIHLGVRFITHIEPLYFYLSQFSS